MANKLTHTDAELAGLAFLILFQLIVLIGIPVCMFLDWMGWQ